ncbi:MAG TPA: ABC transporter permease [Candidatus Acidoferrales bacterium]|nr:ABC transporter permease [Candidatus Acidoferrales bacterium]
MDSLAAQLKQVFRRLGRAPMFTFITLLMLAAGIGANTAVFSVVEGVLLKPLPYSEPGRLVGVWHTAPGLNIPQLDMSPSNYFIYSEQSRAFQSVGIYQNDSVSVTGVGEPEQVPSLDVTKEVLPILGVRPLLGRLFSAQDVLPSSAATILLTYGYWQHKYGGSSSAIGRTIIADGKPREIIGVLPQDFRFLDRPDIALIVPIQFDRAKTFLGQFSYDGLARLRAGVTLAEANADVARMLPIVLRSFPPPPGFSVELFQKAHITPDLSPLMQDVVGNVRSLLWVLMAGIGMVLLIACANVANLFLVRTEGRQQELAIRAALGASRGRIAGELLFESVVIGLMGSILGLGVAWAALRLLIILAPSGLPRLNDIGIDLPVLLFTLGISLFTSLLFGMIPILKYAGARVGTGLREGGRTLSQSRERHRARNVLVTVQVALALVLLIGSGLMIRTFRALVHVNPGFSPAQVQTFSVYIPSTSVPDPVNVVRAQQEMSDKIAALPGVSSVAFSNAIPMDGNAWNDAVFAQDRAYAQGELPALRRFIFVSPEYFHTLDIPLIAGRNLAWSDIYNKLPVALVSENFARDYWRTPQNAIGKRIRVSTIDDWREIIGVVGDVHYDGMDKPAPSIAYWPTLAAKFESSPINLRREVVFSIRTPRAGSQAFLNEVRQAVWSINSSLPLSSIHTLDYFYNQSMARTSFTLVMLGIAGAMALLLGAVGLYGVIAYSVSQRTREIGIRIALGAQQNSVVGMFVRQGLLLTGIGVACGLAAGFGVMRLMSSLLFGVSALDPVTYAGVTAILIAIALLASYLPSRRAANVNPVEALRAE